MTINLRTNVTINVELTADEASVLRIALNDYKRRCNKEHDRAEARLVDLVRAKLFCAEADLVTVQQAVASEPGEPIPQPVEDAPTAPIPAETLDEVSARHKAGRGDPPIHVTEKPTRNLRQRIPLIVGDPGVSKSPTVLPEGTTILAAAEPVTLPVGWQLDEPLAKRTR